MSDQLDLLALAIVRLARTDARRAQILGVSRRTITDWRASIFPHSVRALIEAGVLKVVVPPPRSRGIGSRSAVNPDEQNNAE